jgi:hypothetical protein
VLHSADFASAIQSSIQNSVYSKAYEAQRPRRRWVDNIKMDLREVGWDGVDWMDMAQGRDQWRALVNTVLNLWVP